MAVPQRMLDRLPDRPGEDIHLAISEVVRGLLGARDDIKPFELAELMEIDRTEFARCLLGRQEWRVEPLWTVRHLYGVDADVLWGDVW